jgi:CRISPR type I-F-associated protein Csy2
MFGNETNSRAIIVPVARVDNVSVATASLLVSPPSPLAALGLARRMELDLQRVGILPSDRISFRSVAVAVHEFEVAPGHRRIPPEMRGEGGNKAGSMVDDPEGHLLCTLIISADIGDAEMLRAVRDYLSRNIRRYRLGGGRIIRSGFVTARGGADRRPTLNPVEAAWDEDEFQRVVRVLPPGSVLADRTHMLAENPDAPDGCDALDRLLDFVAVMKRPIRTKGHLEAAAPNVDDEENSIHRVEADRKLVQAGKWEWARKEAGWFVPVAVGWRALSDVRKRAGMRHGEGVVGHVWAEDVLGLGEWISIKRAFRHPDKNGDRGVFGTAWAYQQAPPEGPYLAAGDNL